MSAVQAGKRHLLTKHTADPNNTVIVFVRREEWQAANWLAVSQ